MSGDVQPRKRKDKKKKKDELGIEEPRGTAAALGEGDVFMHSYHDHGTGGHWCAKVIFFSLLAVLLTLIGLIILENRGLSELEANAVESRYSGILEGWLEDAPDDDHHDAHTLELKHHDEEEDDHDHKDAFGDDEDDLAEHSDEDEGHEDEQHEDEDEERDDEDAQNEDEDEGYENEDEDEDHDNEDEDNDEHDSQDLEADDEDEDERSPYKYYAQEDEDDNEKDEDEDEVDQFEQDEDQDQDDEQDENASNELEGDDDEEDDDDDENENSREDEDEHEDEHEDEEDEEIEVEKIEQEASEEEEPISINLPALPEEDDDDKSDDKDDHDEDDNEDEENDDGYDQDEDEEFLEADESVVERITAPAGKPYIEVEEDDVSQEQPPDTLEEEEEYEKQQEELRREEEQSSSHMWLKLSVGGALLVATHAVLRRATAPRDEPEEERVAREATPVDRRMTLISEQASQPVVSKKIEEKPKPGVEEIVRHEIPVVKSAPGQESEEDIEEPEPEEIEEEIEEIEEPKKKAGKDVEELYSDEEVEEEEEEEIVVQKKEAPKLSTEPPKPKPEPEPEPEDEDPDDVEIIDDEQLEEELEDEEEISDVDDTELLSRLEAKYGRLPEPERYGRLPEPERPGQRPKDGGNSVEDDWPGEPADAYWRQQLDSAERDLRQGSWTAAAERASAAELAGSGRARHVVAAALDRLAEAQRDNRVLSRAIAAYLQLLKMNEDLSDKKLLEVAQRTLNRIQFIGNYLKAEPIYRLLIRRFPKEPAFRNNLTISFLMANRADLAQEVLKETLVHWPNDRVALAHYAFVLKTQHNKYEDAVDLFQKALEGDKGPACEPRFYYHYGDALLLLGRFKEAHEVHKRAAKYGHFLSPVQRSLYNIPRLKSQPWWNVEETPYAKLARTLEKSWKDILKEGEAAKSLYEEEKEGLRERGDWSQMDLFVRGQELPGRCKRAPVTCSIVKSEPAATGCRRGQVKFSAMEAGTHVRPHVGPTNCRLRMHLGLSNTKNTHLRVDQETRQWHEGKVLIFDDSYEHEVWHNGTGKRLVLIVDVWHPDLTPAERRTLPAI